MKYALIAGAGSDLAKVVIEELQKEFIIFALDINPVLSQVFISHKRVVPFVCDLRDIVQIQSVKDQIEKITTKLDLIINFAGLVTLGSTIEIPVSTVKTMFEVNLLGCYAVNQIFFPLVQLCQGRIINVSSEYGLLLGLPFHSFYTMTKHALEVYNDSLRREVTGLGVKVILIRPGAFSTKMQQNIQAQFAILLEETTHFKLALTRMKSLMDGELKRAKNPTKIIKTFKKVIIGRRPKIAYNIGHSFKMKLLNILPIRLQDWLLSKFL